MIGKKGNFNLLTTGAIAAGSFFMILIVVGLVFVSIGGTSTVNVVYGSATEAIVGESVTIINNTEVSVLHPLVNTGTWAIYNLSNVIPLEHFRFNNVTGTITPYLNATYITYNNTAVSVNYTYDNRGNTVSGDGNATAIVNNAKVANTTLSSLGTIFVYIIFLVAVIGLFALLGYGAYKALK